MTEELAKEECEQQRAAQYEAEYKRILTGLSPPNIEIVRYEEWKQLRTQVNELKRSKMATGSDIGDKVGKKRWRRRIALLGGWRPRLRCCGKGLVRTLS